MLTLKEALQLPILENAQVVAGADGLEQPIRWVHVLSVPNAADWLHGGELLLTTAYNLPDSAEAQGEYLRQLAGKEIAGVVITIGMRWQRLPDSLRAIGAQLQLPLIELPYQTRFVDIAKVINERISEANLDTLSRALSIQQRLTRLVLEGGSFPELARMLADLVGHSISIEDERFEAIANWNIAEVDAARRYTIRHGRTNPALIAALELEILPKIRDTLMPLQLPILPQLGLEMERLLAPIVVHGEIYGYMWIIADVRALTPIDMMAIEIGATVAALLMLHQESLHSAEASLKGSLMAQLIEGAGDSQTILSDQSLRYGLDLRLPWRMLIVNTDEERLPANAAYRKVNQALVQSKYMAVAAQFAGQVVILAQEGADIKSLGKDLAERLHTGGSLKIAVSGKFSGAEQVSAAHAQCLEVLAIARRIGAERPLHFFDDLGYIHALYYAGAASLTRNAQVPRLRRLLKAQQADLFQTLEAYLDAGGNSVQTAERLHIHRSTLNYRLARIKEICEVDLSAPITRMNLHIAIKLMRLFDDLPGA